MPRTAWIIVFLALAGCAEHAPAPPPNVPMASRACYDVARLRMNDAAANRYDAATQQVIFRGTYEDCARWQGKATDVTSRAR